MRLGIEETEITLKLVREQYNQAGAIPARSVLFDESYVGPLSWGKVMSADNWRKCPKCLKAAKESREKAVQKARARYGKISESEYLKLITKSAEPIDLEETLRENYCQRIDEDGEFQSSYYCYCERCGFEFQHKYGQAVDL